MLSLSVQRTFSLIQVYDAQASVNHTFRRVGGVHHHGDSPR